MNLLDEGSVAIVEETDIVTVRQTVREAAGQIGLGVTDVTRVVTAASELARNGFKYGNGGSMTWKLLESEFAKGIELTFQDKGPGIPDIEQALQDGFSTGGGLGMGLPGAKKLMDEMSVDSSPQIGTRVVVRKWRSI